MLEEQEEKDWREKLAPEARRALGEELMALTAEYESFLAHPFLVRVKALVREDVRKTRDAVMETILPPGADCAMRDLYKKVFAKLMQEIGNGDTWSRAFESACERAEERVREQSEYLGRHRDAAERVAEAAEGASSLLGDA
jgi:hypothetical protein